MSALEIVAGFVIAAVLRAFIIALLIIAVGFAIVRTVPRKIGRFISAS